MIAHCMEHWELPRVAIITTGGTIASLPDPETGAVRPEISGDDLVAAAPGLSELAWLEPITFASVPSWNLTPERMWELRIMLDELLGSGKYAGAVITHGTDTVEETAYMLYLGLTSPLPVAFAVAMRNAGEVGADGPRNLLDAVRVVSNPASSGRGPMLVVNGEMHSPEHVTKTHTSSVCTFQSPGHGPIGSVGQSGVRYRREVTQRKTLSADGIEPRVALVKVVTGMGPEMLQFVVDRGARGLIIEGSGAGNIPDSAVPGVRYALDRGVTVVLVSRCLEGDVTPVYGTAGGGKSLLEMGVIPGGALNGQKARIRLMLALGDTKPLADVGERFRDGL